MALELEEALAQQTLDYLKHKAAESVQQSHDLQSVPVSNAKRLMGLAIRDHLKNLLRPSSEDPLFNIVDRMINEQYPVLHSKLKDWNEDASTIHDRDQMPLSAAPKPNENDHSRNGSTRSNSRQLSTTNLHNESPERHGAFHDTPAHVRSNTSAQPTSPSMWSDNQHMDRYMDLWIKGFPNEAFSHMLQLGSHDPLRGDRLFEIMEDNSQSQLQTLIAARQQYRAVYPEEFPETTRPTPSYNPRDTESRATATIKPIPTTNPLATRPKKAPDRPKIPREPIPGYRFKCSFANCGTERKDKVLFTEHMSRTHFRDEETAVGGKFFISRVSKTKLIWAAKLRDEDTEERCVGVFAQVPPVKKHKKGLRRKRDDHREDEEESEVEGEDDDCKVN